MASRLYGSTSTLSTPLIWFLRKTHPFQTSFFSFILLCFRVLTSCSSYPEKVNELWWNSLKMTINSALICYGWWWRWRLTDWNCLGQGWRCKIWETIRVLVVWLLHCHSVLVGIETRNVGLFIWPIPWPGLAEHARHVLTFGICNKNPNQSQRWEKNCW